MTPLELNLQIVQGANYGPRTLYLTNSATGNAANVTGYTFRAEVRPAGCGVGAVLANFAPAVANGANGEISYASLTSIETANIPAGIHRWDLMGRNSGGYTFGPLASGRVVVVPSVTEFP